MTPIIVNIFIKYDDPNNVKNSGLIIISKMFVIFNDPSFS